MRNYSKEKPTLFYIKTIYNNKYDMQEPTTNIELKAPELGQT